MIQPIQSGAVLLNDIASTQPGPRQAAIWWFGQSGYAIKTASALWYIDPYLSEHLTIKYASTEMPHVRMTAAPLHGADLTGVEWIFASHRHSDHMDPGTLPDLFRISPDARLVLPAATVDHAVSLGLPRERLIPMRGEDTQQVGPLTVHAIPSAHPEFSLVEGVGYPFLGFVFQVDGLTIYHSGDTLAYDGLAERLRAFPIDLAFLPINGTNEQLKRFGTPPNMNMHDAVQLAQSAKLRLVVPHHYDMFTFNTASVDEFAVLAGKAGVPYVVLQPGQKWLMTGG